MLIQGGVLGYNTKAQYDTVSVPKCFLPVQSRQKKARVAGRNGDNKDELSFM